MRRIHQDVQFHHNTNPPHRNGTFFSSSLHNPTSHELDASAMRNILTLLMNKTLETKKKQKENPHHRYEGVYRESANIDKPPIMQQGFDPKDLFDISDRNESSFEVQKKSATEIIKSEEQGREISDYRLNETSKSTTQIKFEISKIQLTSDEKLKNREEINVNGTQIGANSSQLEKVPSDKEDLEYERKTENALEMKKVQEIERIKEIEKKIDEMEDPTSAEIFGEVMRKIISQGKKGKKIFQQLLDGIDDEELKQRLVGKMENLTKLEEEERKRKRRDLILSSPLRDELNKDDEEGDVAIEEVFNNEMNFTIIKIN